MAVGVGERRNIMFSLLHDKFLSASRVAVWCGGLALLLSAVMVTLDVLSRKFIGYTISGADEISGYVFAASTTWAYSYCLLTRSNIRIDFLYNLVSVKLRAFLDMVGLLLLLYYIYLLTTKSFVLFMENVEQDATAQTTLATPLWIPQVFWVSGLGFFLLTLIFIAIYGFVAMFRRDWATVNRIAGVRTVEEEITEETHV